MIVSNDQSTLNNEFIAGLDAYSNRSLIEQIVRNNFPYYSNIPVESLWHDKKNRTVFHANQKNAYFKLVKAGLKVENCFIAQIYHFGRGMHTIHYWVNMKMFADRFDLPKEN